MYGRTTDKWSTVLDTQTTEIYNEKVSCRLMTINRCTGDSNKNRIILARERIFTNCQIVQAKTKTKTIEIKCLKILIFENKVYPLLSPSYNCNDIGSLKNVLLDG